MKKEKAQTDKNIQKLEKIYLEASGRAVIKASIQAIPCIGGSLAELIFSKAQKIKEKRVRELIDGLREKYELLDENKIDKDYLNSEDFLFLVEVIFGQAIHESKEKKREMYQSILRNATLIKFKRFDKELLLNLFINTPPFYLQLLMDCKKVTNVGRSSVYLSGLYKIRKDFKLGESKKLTNHLLYLSSLGLLNHNIEVNVDGTAVEGYLETDTDTEDIFTISGLGKDLLNFIEINN